MLGPSIEELHRPVPGQLELQPCHGLGALQKRGLEACQGQMASRPLGVGQPYERAPPLGACEDQRVHLVAEDVDIKQIRERRPVRPQLIGQVLPLAAADIHEHHADGRLERKTTLVDALELALAPLLVGRLNHSCHQSVPLRNSGSDHAVLLLT